MIKLSHAFLAEKLYLSNWIQLITTIFKYLFSKTGKNSDILIHEATHEDSLDELAKAAKHRSVVL